MPIFRPASGQPNFPNWVADRIAPLTGPSTYTAALSATATLSTGFNAASLTAIASTTSNIKVTASAALSAISVFSPSQFPPILAHVTWLELQVPVASVTASAFTATATETTKTIIQARCSLSATTSFVANSIIGLRSAAGSFYVGFASQSIADISDQTYWAVAAREFNAVEPENVLKFGDLQATQGVWDFANADATVAKSVANNQTMLAAGPLIWGNNIPFWLSSGTWTSGTLTTVMYAHIDTVLSHYAGQFPVLEVVNEPIHQSSIWNDTIGSTYIDLAFRRAHAADPNAILIINEYGCEQTGGDGDTYFSLVQGLLAGGTPIHGVGFQAHLDLSGLDQTSFKNNLARFAALGLKLYITEMDVKIPDPGTNGTDLTNQASIYGNTWTTALAQPAVKGIAVWGLSDAYSWIPSAFPGFGHATLLNDTTFGHKATWDAAYAALIAAPHQSASLSATASLNAIAGHACVMTAIASMSASIGQRIYPVADTTVGSWITDQGASTNLWQTINSELDIINAGSPDGVLSPFNPASTTYVVRMASMQPPGGNGPRTLTFEYKKTVSTGQVDLVVDLLQNTTVLQTWTYTDVAANFSVSQQVITVPIFNWSTPFDIRFTANQSS